MQPKYIAYQGSEIFYRITGKGRPVVLIHGFGEDGDIWQKQVDFLKDHLPTGQAGFQLIIPDLPGSGRSEFIENADIETYSALIKEIITSELQFPLQGAEGVVLLGHSLGGYITLAFAEKYPQMLSSFGLIHSSAFADTEEKKAARLKSIEFISTHSAYDFLRTAIPGLFHLSGRLPRPDGLNDEMEDLIEKGRNFSSEALIQYYQAMIARPDRTHVLKTFSKPILFIIGQHDNAVPFTQSLQQCYLPMQSHIHILRYSAHMGIWEEEKKVNGLLKEFLNSTGRV